MWIGCPVLGLRPERAARFLFSKVPNPTNATLSPAFNAVVIEQSKAFRAAAYFGESDQRFRSYPITC